MKERFTGRGTLAAPPAVSETSRWRFQLPISQSLTVTVDCGSRLATLCEELKSGQTVFVSGPLDEDDVVQAEFIWLVGSM